MGGAGWEQQLQALKAEERMVRAEKMDEKMDERMSALEQSVKEIRGGGSSSSTANEAGSSATTPRHVSLAEAGKGSLAAAGKGLVLAKRGLVRTNTFAQMQRSRVDPLAVDLAEATEEGGHSPPTNDDSVTPMASAEARD